LESFYAYARKIPPRGGAKLRSEGAAKGVLRGGGKLRPYFDFLGAAAVVGLMISAVGHVADDFIVKVLGVLLHFLIGLGIHIHGAHSYY